MCGFCIRIVTYKKSNFDFHDLNVLVIEELGSSKVEPRITRGVITKCEQGIEDFMQLRPRRNLKVSNS